MSGYCNATVGGDYPYVKVDAPDSAGTAGDAGALGEWCANWCGQVEPVKLVGRVTYPKLGRDMCYCLYSSDNMPNPFGDGYDPAPTLVVADRAGSGCVNGIIGGEEADYNFNCYPNDAYQCT